MPKKNHNAKVDFFELHIHLTLLLFQTRDLKIEKWWVKWVYSGGFSRAGCRQSMGRCNSICVLLQLHGSEY